MTRQVVVTRPGNENNNVTIRAWAMHICVPRFVPHVTICVPFLYHDCFIYKYMHATY